MNPDTVTLTKEQFDQLQSHSHMLGQIGAFVENFCDGEEDTTLNAVLRLLAEYHSLMSEYHHARLETIIQCNELSKK